MLHGLINGDLKNLSEEDIKLYTMTTRGDVPKHGFLTQHRYFLENRALIGPFLNLSKIFNQ